MRFSYWVRNTFGTDEILRSGTRAAETGWGGLWFADHFVPPMGDLHDDCHEVWTVLSALAVLTKDVRLGPLVCGNTYRNPAVLLNQAVTADHLAAGRMVLGIGAGWQQNEHVAYGIEFGTFTDRFEKLEEALQIITGLLKGGGVDFAGERYQMVNAPLSPKPVGEMPIMIGGGGEKKTLRMVAQYAQEWNIWADPETMVRKGAVLDAHCEALDRDPASISRSAAALLFLTETEAEAAKLREVPMTQPALIGTVEQLKDAVAAYQAVGVDELIIPDFSLGDDTAKKDAIADKFINEVAADFRD